MAFKHREYAKFAAKRDEESDHPFGYLTQAEDVVKHYGTRLEGKTVVVTGANTGLGKETARVLATTGAEIVLAVRSMERGEAAAEDIRGEVENATIVVMHLDLGSIASVRSFAESYMESGRGLHILIMNAGIMACPFGKTEDGLERQFGASLGVGSPPP